MKTLELRLRDGNYVIVNDGRASSTTFDGRFRIMAINKFKFLAKNTVTPFVIIVDDAKGNELINTEVNQLGVIDTIK